MLFNGTDGIISMGDDAAFEFTAAFTIEVWAKYTTAGNTLVSKFASSFGGWTLGTSAGNALQFFAGTSGGATVFSCLTTLGYNNGGWHHVAAVSDGVVGANRARIYVDSAVAGQATINAGTIDANTAPFLVAARFATPANFFGGTLAFIAVYPTALTAAQVANHYNLGTGGQGGTGSEFRSRYRWRDAA